MTCTFDNGYPQIPGALHLRGDADMSGRYGAALHRAELSRSPHTQVVALGPGGGTDTTARIVSQKLSEQMSVAVGVENRPGTGTVIGVELDARAAPDGYTLMSSSPELSINARMHAKLPLDTLKDVTTNSQLTTGQYLLSTHPSVPVRSVRDLIALARIRAEQVTDGSSGAGSPDQSDGMLLQHMRCGIKQPWCLTSTQRDPPLH